MKSTFVDNKRQQFAKKKTYHHNKINKVVRKYFSTQKKKTPLDDNKKKLPFVEHDNCLDELEHFYLDQSDNC